MLCDYCICTYMSYSLLCVLCSASCKDGSEKNSVNAWYIAEELFRINVNISLSMWRGMIALFLSCNIRKCIVSGWRCYSISNLKFVLFFDLFLLCHGDIESNQAPKKSSNCQPLKFVIITSIAYYQKIVLKYLSWNLSMICITLTLYVFSKLSYVIQWALRMIFFLKVH